MLQNGIIKFSGGIVSVVDHYLSDETVKGVVNNEWNFEDVTNRIYKSKKCLCETFKYLHNSK